MSTFYRRPLPEALVPFASDEGRRIFGEALAEGHLASWFPLAQHFHTQADPAFCGLGTLVMVLNALEIDPGRLWKGPWRWFGEEMLDCCKPLDAVRAGGLALDELACLARCNGARADVRHADAADLEAFRADLARAATAPAGPFVVVNYHRGALGQTGTGHFSPVAGIHAGRDLALVLDVARFKYPPHWVPIPRLWEALAPTDPDTGRSRGWAVVDRSPLPLALAFRLHGDPQGWAQVAAELAALPGRLVGETADALLLDLVERLPTRIRGLVAVADRGDAAHQALVADVLARVRRTRLYARLARSAPSAEGLEPLVIALWVWPREPWAASPAELRDLLRPDDADDVLRAELDAIRAQVGVLDRYCRCGSAST